MSRLLNKISDKAKRTAEKFDDQLDKVQAGIARLPAAVRYTYNPNHRHDEEHEQAEDRARQEIIDSHRYQSFADQRSDNDAKWFIDGADYFWALSEILEEAQSTIWICDWWLSPELYLRRPPAANEQYRLDRVLKRAAERGVRVFVMVYKEVTASMTLGSKHTKHALEELHENISCMRHPDHSGGEISYFYSHHSKIVIVDNAIACVGGLDLCYGRYDTHSAPMADVETDLLTQIFPGQDYNNARVADFENVESWAGNQQARLQLGRMPWHDIHTMFVGPAVMDVAQYFVERWNFTRGLKYKHSDRFPLLDWPHDDPLNDQLARHPHTARLRQLGHRFNQVGVHIDRRKKGDMRIQVCRSVGDWSAGWLTEHSILNAYIQNIREANHFIYIENQFFVSIPGDQSVAHNTIALALVERIMSAAKAGEKFKVMIVIPEVPCFAGDVKATSSVSTIIDFQYRSICRGKDSMFGMLEAQGISPRDYISLFNLRIYDRIKFDPAIWEQIERQSGVRWPQVLAAIARMNIGDTPGEIEEENNRTLRFKPMKYGETIDGNAAATDKNKKGEEDVQTIELPPNTAAAMSIIRAWEAATPPELRNISSSIARNTLQSGRSTAEEPWYGSEEAEKDAFVSEELYIHSKLAIFDDRTVICGSANINDRSMLGDRDSEIAVVIEDNDMIESVMDGQKYMATRFAATLRRRLFRQHLGLITPQEVPGPVENASRAVGIANEYDFGTPEDLTVADPLNDEFQQLWNETAQTNARIYQRLFHCVPASGIRTWEDYKAFVPVGKKVGHIYNQEQYTVQQIKEELSKIRGHITEMPLDFLERAGLSELSAAVNPLTMPIYL